MEKQTDGVEWVMVTMFVIAMLIVIAAAVREVRRARAGDPGGEPDHDEAHRQGGSKPPA